MAKTGTFTGNARGYGFITPQGGGEDIFVPPHQTGGAINGDTVTYRALPPSHSPTAQVTEVIKRGKPTMVGTFSQGHVIPLDGRIPCAFTPTPKSKARFALADGHRVVFSVKRKDPSHCVIAEIIGHVNDPGIDVLSLIQEYRVPHVFPPKVLEEAAEIPQDIPAEGRLDLRGAEIFTIDGEDTKDIDDAVSLETLPGGAYRLGVHIADVAHYVREGTALDKEAFKRGNSVYLADRVIPMLPHALSNGICSLNPGRDRLALSCLMEINGGGYVTGHSIFPSMIRSRHRFTYERVLTLLNGAEPDAEEAPFLPTLTQMNRLREILNAKRTQRGALCFNLPEAKIRVDENNKPVSVEVYPHNEATGLIEEFMIVCNETVAGHFYARRVPFLYRVHEPPEPEKLRRLQAMLKEFRLKLHGSRFNELLYRVKDKPYAYAVTQALLRSQQQARYTPAHDRHFGLASECYTHFTSPIRRYPDLMNHRIIKATIAGEDTKRFKAPLPEIGGHCSGTERTAEALERAVAQLKKAQFMLGKEGQIFEGTVSAIEKHGVYVMLNNTIEGLVPEELLRRIPKKRRPVFLPGQKVTVRLASVDAEERKVYFSVPR
jgi:ribonuclease R